MTKKITIVDYGLGNMLSIGLAVKHCGADAVFSNSPAEIKNASYLILPGVGAFSAGMAQLNSLGIVDSLLEYAEMERPFLGICLGMQMLLESSNEFGHNAGLGIIPGKVEIIPTINNNHDFHKIPHIGWNNLILSSDKNTWSGTLLQNIGVGSSVYFLHSYLTILKNEKHCLANCDYNGIKIPAVLRRGLLYGCQFHPEKSGKVGLKIIHEFLKL